MSGLNPGTSDLHRLLGDGERLRWSRLGQRRAATVGGVCGGLVGVILLGAVVTVVGTIVWALAAPTTPTDPFVDVWDRGRIVGVIALVVSVLVFRRFFLGSPARGLLVTDRRVLVVEDGRWPRIREEQDLSSLPFLSRRTDRRGRSLYWRVIRDHDGTSKAGRYYGLLNTDLDLVDAERQVLLASTASGPEPDAFVGATGTAADGFVESLLHRGEHLTWVEPAHMPSMVKRYGPMVAFVVSISLALVLVAVGYGLLSAIQHRTGMFEIALRGFFVFVVVIMFLGSLALRKGLRIREADVAVYAVTTWRALIAVRDDRGELLVTSYPPVSLDQDTTKSEAGRPAITLTRHIVPQEGFLLSQTRFNEVHDVRGAVAALDQLVSQRRPGR